MADNPALFPVTCDGFLDKKVRLSQPQRGYRVAIDPVFLAASLPLKAHQSILDCGCGVGAISCFLLSREPSLKVTGIDKNKALLDLAVANHAHNGFEASFLPIDADLSTLHLGETFDHVVSNPPFYPHAVCKKSPTPLRTEAHIQTVSLGQWLSQMMVHLKLKGRLSVILPPERLGEFFHWVEERKGHEAGLGDVRIFPLWPTPQTPAKRLILWGYKGTKGPLHMLPGLPLHEVGKAYTPSAEAVLRGASLASVTESGVESMG